MQVLRAARSSCRGFYVKGDGRAIGRMNLRRRGGTVIRAGHSGYSGYSGHLRRAVGLLARMSRYRHRLMQ